MTEGVNQKTSMEIRHANAYKNAFQISLTNLKRFILNQPNQKISLVNYVKVSISLDND